MKLTLLFRIAAVLGIFLSINFLATQAALAQQVIDIAATEQDITIVGADSNDSLSNIHPTGIATGDFNNDGIQDILIGAQLGDGPGNTKKNAGEAYIIFGKPSLSSGMQIDLLSNDQDIVIFGAASNLCGSGDFLGLAVASGDLNGDGIDDIIIGAPLAGGAAGGLYYGPGEVYIIFGNAALVSGISFDIAKGDQDVTINGGSGQDRVGFSLAAGDLNGDNIEDLAIGAILANGSGPLRTRAGKAYIIFGSDSLKSGRLFNIAAGHHDITILGRFYNFNLGQSLTMGDFNNDGLKDLLVGTASTSNGYGEAIVVLGSNTLSKGQTIDTAEGQQDITILPGDFGDQFSTSSCSCDLNGDGVDDMILGAPSAEGPDNLRDWSGEVYVIFGSESLASGDELSIRLDDHDVTIFGAEKGDYLGQAVACGNFNSDGTMDLITGASSTDGPDNTRSRESGEAYIIFGSSDTLSSGTVIDIALNNQDMTIFGSEPGDNLGFSAALGDINADGADDLILGAPFADGPDNLRNNAGEVYVFFGAGSSVVDQIDDIIEQIEELVNSDEINQGQGNALIVKLQAALKKIDQANPHTAINQLEAFMSQVDAFIRTGKLTIEQGQPLIDAAQVVIWRLSN